MKTEKSYSAWKEGTCVPADVLWDYVEGKLSANQQHKVERHVLDCPLCADALEGFQHSGKRARITQINAEIGKQITYRSDWYLGAAAATVVAVAASGLLWWALGTHPVQDNIAQTKTPAKNETTISAQTPSGTDKGSDVLLPSLNRPSVSSDGFLSTSPEGNLQGLQAPPASGSFTPAPVSPSASYQWNSNTYYIDTAPPVAADETNKDDKAEKEERSLNVAMDSVNSLPEDRSYKSNAAESGSGGMVGNGPGTSAGVPDQQPREANNANTRKPVKSKQAPASPAAPAEKKASLAEGMYYYNTSNYSEAIKIFKKVLNDDPNNQEARYYLGMSYKGSGDKTKALEELSKVASSCVYYDDAVWNRSLLLIEAGRKEEARVLLQQLIDGGGKYAQKAMNKLGEL